jgi:hypothetical protein
MTRSDDAAVRWSSLLAVLAVAGVVSALYLPLLAN